MYAAVSIGAIGALVTMPDHADVEVGQTLRIGESETGSRVGRVTGVDGGRISIDTDAGSMSISTDSLAYAYVNAGNGRRWAQGWGIGFVVGAGAGALLGYASGDDPPGVFIRFNREQKAALAGGLLAIGGSAVGALIGLAGPDRWVRATRPIETSRVSVDPMIGTRVGLTARIAF